MVIGKIVDRMDTLIIFPPVICKVWRRHYGTSKTKYMTGLMDKAIAKVNQNELDWYEKFFQHSLFCI
jgi:hypothetical protein